ncbi:hypothetical protein, partial [Curvivirga aplysinae]|uniref:hypothetical protein n=1 Tax=Curvivirga aplysinae TaxID=2529852 RepID=UPI001C3F982E
MTDNLIKFPSKKIKAEKEELHLETEVFNFLDDLARRKYSESKDGIAKTNRRLTKQLASARKELIYRHKYTALTFLFIGLSSLSCSLILVSGSNILPDVLVRYKDVSAPIFLIPANIFIYLYGFE